MGKRQVPTRPDYIKWLLLAGAAALGVLLCAYVAWHYILPHSVNVDRYRYPVAGIDVSRHNGVIDFEQVRDDNYQFVVIKATEGKTYKDDAFERNYDGARQAGLKVGVYHFFRKNTDGLNQAKNFLETIGWRKLDLPLVIDVEDWSNDKNVKDDRTQKHLDAMIDNLRSRGHQVMIYTNGDGYKKYIKDGQININLWLCAFKNPDKLKHIPHQMQQYSHWGRVKGIWGDVDLNVFNGSQQQWDKWLKDLTPYQVEEAYIDSTQIDDNEFYIIDDEI